MKHRIVSGMCAALFDSDLIATRLTLALAELTWAVMLLWPGDTFSRPTYTVMGHIAPETAWALVFLSTSLIQYSIVALDSCRSQWAHRFASWNALLWVTTIVCMLMSVYPPPAAVGGEIALMTSAIWIWVRPLIVHRGEQRHAAAY